MTYIERIVDISTGETIERNYDAKEIAELEKNQVETEKRVELQNAKTIAKAALLAKLGITQEEAALLLGGN